MRKLAKSETRLLLIFGSAVFLAVNLFAVRAWLSHRAGVFAAIAEARTSLSTTNSWITAAEALDSARDWMQQHPAPVEKHDSASTALLNTVRAICEKSGLKIAEETLLPSEEADGTQAAVLQIKITGPFSGVAAFLFELQNPTCWRSVEKLMIRSDSEPPNVVVDMDIHQYFRLPETNPTPATSE
ncbi:MAG: GspMb/PilO family protein [bacterium]